MGFFSKLFKRKKKTLNSSKSEELKEETRVISMGQESEGKVRILDENPATCVYSAEVANNVLSKLLVQAIANKELKEYANIKKFVKKYPPIDDYILDGADIDFPRTEDIKKLFNTWYMLGYKCTNTRLNNLMERMR